MEYKGFLVVVDDWEPMYMEPKLLRHFWPTGIDAKLYPGLIGAKLKAWPSGRYTLVDEPNKGMMIALENGGSTKPILTEEKPIKKPKGKTAWRYGKWQ
jgi:hypothetical protein